MSGTRGLRWVALFFCAALATGCGDDDDSASDEEAEVREAIEHVAGSTTPEDCTTYATQAYLEQTTFKTGAEAVAECEEQADTTAVVEIEEVAIDGDAATATVATIEGELEGSTVAVTLIRDGDAWKLDSLDDFVVFDRDSYREGLEETMTEDGTSPTAIQCVLGNFDALPDDDLESLLLSGVPAQLAQLAHGCA